MGIMRIVLCLLLATGCGCDRGRGPNADVQSELSSYDSGFGRGLMLFAATVMEGGGQRGSTKDPPLVVVDITHAFEQGRTPGQLTLGTQPVIWTVRGKTRFDEQWEFETPVNGTRIIAFATDSPGRIKVFADHVFADTGANRAVASAFNQSHWRMPVDVWIAGTLFLASLAFAFVASIVAWFRVKYGLIALAVGLALWFALEVITPSEMLRFDLLLLLPLQFAAVFSVGLADGKRKRPLRGQDPPEHRLRGL
jgi:hypothetical protein